MSEEAARCEAVKADGGRCSRTATDGAYCWQHAQDSPRTVVTMVHGTWGKNSPFVSPDSPLQGRLQHELGDGVHFSVFQWSGRNRVSSRLEAAEELRQHLVRLSGRYPNARQFIAAHSHGGNVALYALKDASADSIVSGVICFSTPFIVVSSRSATSVDVYSRVLRIALTAPLSALTVLLLYGLAQIDFLTSTLGSLFKGIASLFGESEAAITTGVFLGAISVLGCAVAILVWSLPITRHVVKGWLALAGIHKARLQMPDIGSDRLLILRTAADEASAAIAVTRFLHWVTSAVFEVAFGVILLPLQRAFSAVWRTLQRAWEEGLYMSLLVFLLAALILWLVLLVLSLLVTIPVAVAMLLSRVGGIAYGSTSLFLHSSAENCPPGSHVEHLYGATSEDGGLVHSASYRNPAAVERAAAWISGGKGSGTFHHPR